MEKNARRRSVKCLICGSRKYPYEHLTASTATEESDGQWEGEGQRPKIFKERMEPIEINKL